MVATTPAALPTLADRLAERCAVRVDLARDALVAPLRPSATTAVLDITEWFGAESGGIRTYLLQKAAYVAARSSLRQTLVVPGRYDSRVDADGTRAYRVGGPAIPGQPPYRLMLSPARVRRIVAAEAPDVIEAGSALITPWLARRAAATYGVPLVGFYHSNLPSVFASRRKTKQQRNGVVEQSTAMERLAWRYVRRLHAAFDMTIATSEYARSALTREGIEHVVHIPLGVDLLTFTPARRGYSAATRAHHALPEGLLAGYVGRFAGEKELEVLLDAWGDVERRTGARLVLVGAGPSERRLRAHSYAPRVYFLPFQSRRDALADLFACFDLYVSPGRIETFGLSSLEAMASGTPVLAADSGGVAEQIDRSGAGRRFASGVATSLADEASTLLTADLPRLGALGRSYAERHHAWDSVFDRLFHAYSTLAHA